MPKGEGFFQLASGFDAEILPDFKEKPLPRPDSISGRMEH